MTAPATWGRLQACIFGVLVLGVISWASAQVTYIAHFVAPSYPPLARQTLLSGRVSLEVTVDSRGTVTNAAEKEDPRDIVRGSAAKALAHPLLAQEAKACVKEWKFQPTTGERKVGVIFYYGFSGDTRETNPRTVVKADFEESFVRVFITTDLPPVSHP